MPFDAAPATCELDHFLASVERPAFRLAQLALGQREDALDVVQEAMLRVVGYRKRPVAEWSPLFWSILRRQITDRHRRNAVRDRWQSLLGRRDEPSLDPDDLPCDPGQDPAQQLQQARAWQALGRALRGLPRRQREAFLLRTLQGLDVGETARVMGCSAGSVKTHLFRAMTALRETLKDLR